MLYGNVKQKYNVYNFYYQKILYYALPDICTQGGVPLGPSASVYVLALVPTLHAGTIAK